MKTVKKDPERDLLNRIYYNYARKHIPGAFGMPTRMYYARRHDWLKAQGCYIGRKNKWVSDEHRMAFMLKWQ